MSPNLYFLLLETRHRSFRFLSRALHPLLDSFLNGRILSVFFYFSFSFSICPYFALSSPRLSLNTTPLLGLCFMRCDSWSLVAEAGRVDWNVKLCIQPAAAGFVEDLNSLHPYSTSYTGTAFIMLSWHESAELEGGESGEREKITL